MKINSKYQLALISLPIIIFLSTCKKSTQSEDFQIPDTGSYALSFNGKDGFISTGSKYNNPDNFTLELWFNTTSDSGGKLIGFEDSQLRLCEHFWDRHIYMDNFGKLYFGLNPEGAGVPVLESSKSYNDGDWHHVAASLSDLGMFLYIDGALIADNTDITGGEIFRGYWKIGGGNLEYWLNCPSSYHFKGIIDEVRIWNLARPQSDIQKNMNREISSEEYGLLNYWRFNEGVGNTVYDRTLSNNGSLDGGIEWVVSTAPIL